MQPVEHARSNASTRFARPSNRKPTSALASPPSLPPHRVHLCIVASLEAHEVPLGAVIRALLRDDVLCDERRETAYEWAFADADGLPQCFAVPAEHAGIAAHRLYDRTPRAVDLRAVLRALCALGVLFELLALEMAHH